MIYSEYIYIVDIIENYNSKTFNDVKAFSIKSKLAEKVIRNLDHIF